MDNRKDMLIKAGFDKETVMKMGKAQLNNLVNNLFQNTDIKVRKQVKEKEKENLEKVVKADRKQQIKLFSKFTNALERYVPYIEKWALNSGKNSFAIGERIQGGYRYIIRIERKKDTRKNDNSQTTK